jgi:hypothetical protein
LGVQRSTLVEKLRKSTSGALPSGFRTAVRD